MNRPNYISRLRWQNKVSVNFFSCILGFSRKKIYFSLQNATGIICLYRGETSYNLGQNCWDKIENIFFSEKNPLPPNQCFSQSFRLLATKLGQIQHWYREVKGRIWNLKSWGISLIYWIFNFCLNKFCPGLWEILKHKREYSLRT